MLQWQTCNQLGIGACRSSWYLNITLLTSSDRSSLSHVERAIAVLKTFYRDDRSSPSCFQWAIAVSTWFFNGYRTSLSHFYRDDRSFQSRFTGRSQFSITFYRGDRSFLSHIKRAISVSINLFKEWSQFSVPFLKTIPVLDLVLQRSAIPNSECSPRYKSLEVLTVKGFCINMWNQRNALFSDWSSLFAVCWLSKRLRFEEEVQKTSEISEISFNCIKAR